ncbi:Hypothetical protein NocV09_01301320 [Nannochloropsis oceanica]
MRKVRPRPLPSRSSLVICVCLLTCSSPASAFKPQPLRTPSTAAAAHGRPQTTHTRAESVDIREPVSQPWRVSTARYPLIGWPSWGPKLHEAVIVERRDANAAAAGPAYLLFDFIPVSATKISTVTTLFRGQTVPGMIREKVLTFAPPTLAFQGDSRRSLDEIRAFCANTDSDNLVVEISHSYGVGYDSRTLLRFVKLDDLQRTMKCILNIYGWNFNPATILSRDERLDPIAMSTFLHRQSTYGHFRRGRLRLRFPRHWKSPRLS